ncbi:CRISPR-associated protein, Cmr3 family [Chloroherpeton thalassium ATCC 35110]|uniref:CRISPR-associated protein, Cmr3 family n=2 Tax=Chloroherpeton thalassium TaxID=100716 RepID=B3QXD7_CHLT3|nr:CRISPR-associated protein, Cmr3 family [Chloroherpeton thalassium ATCC 35110]
MTKTLKLTALDTLFFRDGRPFSMGDESWANGIFPPPPTVIYGALRTAYFSNHIDRFSKLKSQQELNKSKYDETLKLNINQIYFHYNGGNLFPIPFDILENKDNNEITVLKPEKEFGFSNSETEEILITPQNGQFENIENGFLEASELEAYLTGEIPTSYWKTVISSEPKVGVGQNNQTHASDDGMLYRVGLSRLADYDNNRLEIIVEFSDLEIPSALMRFGGEGKTVELSEHEIPFIKPDPQEIFQGYNSKRFKLYLLTPSYFTEGWKPTLPEGLKLVAAAIGKPLHIGGFDIQKDHPKPLRRFVPAGSIFIIEITNQKNLLDFVPNFHGVSISETEETKRQGFGITFMGRV